MQRPSEPVNHGKKTFWENQGLFNFAQRNVPKEATKFKKSQICGSEKQPNEMKKFFQ